MKVAKQYSESECALEVAKLTNKRMIFIAKSGTCLAQDEENEEAPVVNISKQNATDKQLTAPYPKSGTRLGLRNSELYDDTDPSHARAVCPAPTAVDNVLSPAYKLPGTSAETTDNTGLVLTDPVPL
jgi:hypothetical protein